MAQRAIIYNDKNFSYTLMLDTLSDAYVDSSIKLIVIHDLKSKKLIQKISVEENQFVKSSTEGFIIEDMNFDGYNDFRLLEIRGKRGNMAFYCWLYNPVKNQFEENISLEEISAPYFDTTKKRIHEGWHRASGYGGYNVYKWINNKAVCIFQKEDSVEFYDSDNPIYTDEYGDTKVEFVTVTIRKRIKGKLKLVFKKKYTLKEYDELDDKKLPQPD